MIFNGVIDSTNLNGDTALHVAAEMNHSAIIELLLKGGADPEAKNVFDFTPLQVAAIKGNVESAEILLKYRVDHRVSIRNSQNMTARK